MHDLYELYVLLNDAGYSVKITRWEYSPSDSECRRDDSSEPNIIAIENDLSPEQLKEHSIDAFLKAVKDNTLIIAFNVPPLGFPDDSEPLIRKTELIIPHSLEELEDMERAGYKITDISNNLERMETPIVSGNDATWKLPLHINGKQVTYKLESFRSSRMQNIHTLLELGQPLSEFIAEKILVFDTLDALAGDIEGKQ